MEQNMTGDKSGNGMTPAGDKLQSGVAHASDVVHKKIESIVDATQPAVAGMSEGAHNVVDKVAGAATQAVDLIEETGQYYKYGQERVVRATSKYVHENPIASLAIAVGAGFLFSRLLSSR